MKFNMRYSLVFSFFVSALSHAQEIYVYPELLDEEPAVCDPDKGALDKLIELNSQTSYGVRGIPKHEKSLDINDDGTCEVFIYPKQIDIGNAGGWHDIFTLRDGSYVQIGSVPLSYSSPYRSGSLASGYWYGEMENGYPRIFVRANGGHRTNPIFVTHVMAYNGNKYESEFKSEFSYGRYRELGLQNYKSGNYSKAEKWYLNAYRMEGEKNIDDANNLALVYIKQGMCSDAVYLLKKHLEDNQAKKERSVKAARYNLSLCDK